MPGDDRCVGSHGDRLAAAEIATIIFCYLYSTYSPIFQLAQGLMLFVTYTSPKFMEEEPLPPATATATQKDTVNHSW